MYLYFEGFQIRIYPAHYMGTIQPFPQDDSVLGTIGYPVESIIMICYIYIYLLFARIDTTYIWYVYTYLILYGFYIESIYI